MDETPSLPTLVADSGAPLSRLALHAAARSHPGRIRDGNEDSVLFIQLSGLLAGAPALGPELGFFAVADGIGGHDRGEIASCPLPSDTMTPANGCPSRVIVPETL